MLAAQISSYVRDQLDKISGPLVIQINQTGQVIDVQGDAKRYGLENLGMGDELPETLGYLLFDWDIQTEVLEIPFVHFNDSVVHVHLLRDDEARALLLFDAYLEHRMTSRLQQKANEVGVLLDREQILSARLAKMNIALDEKRQEAELASQAKSHFIASMSHEFRTPITSIMGFAELLQEGVPENHYPGAIRRAAWHLLILVENLLDQARFGEGHAPFNPEPVDVPAVFADLQELCENQARSRGLSLRVGTSGCRHRLLLDELRLRQVLINLIGNALRYTEQGGVEVFCEFQDDSLRIRVQDTGPGISAADQEKIFRPFERLDKSKTGTGLGLSITQQLVELMGGSIGLESELGVGSTFIVDLPSSVAASDQITGGIGGHALVVDDDDDIATLLSIFLAEWGIEVVVENNATHAQQRLLKQEFDYLISDFHLPDGDGKTLAKLAKAQQRAIFVVLTSGSGGKKVHQQESYIDAFIPKPMQMETLQAVLKRRGRHDGAV